MYFSHDMPHIPAGIEYRESDRLSTLGGFLMKYGNHCRITLSHDLSSEEKANGVRYLLAQMNAAPDVETAVYLWTIEPPADAPDVSIDLTYATSPCIYN